MFGIDTLSIHFVWYVQSASPYIPDVLLIQAKVVIAHTLCICESYPVQFSAELTHVLFQGTRLIVNMQRLATPQRLEPFELTTDFHDIHCSKD